MSLANQQQYIKIKTKLKHSATAMHRKTSSQGVINQLSADCERGNAWWLCLWSIITSYQIRTFAMFENVQMYRSHDRNDLDAPTPLWHTVNEENNSEHWCMVVNSDMMKRWWDYDAETTFGNCSQTTFTHKKTHGWELHEDSDGT